MSARLRCTKHTNRHYDKNNCHACRLDEIATLKNKVVGMENTNADLQRQLYRANGLLWEILTDERATMTTPHTLPEDPDDAYDDGCTDGFKKAAAIASRAELGPDWRGMCKNLADTLLEFAENDFPERPIVQYSMKIIGEYEEAIKLNGQA